MVNDEINEDKQTDVLVLGEKKDVSNENQSTLSDISKTISLDKETSDKQQTDQTTNLAPELLVETKSPCCKNVSPTK